MAANIASKTGLEYYPTAAGDSISGTYRQRLRAEVADFLSEDFAIDGAAMLEKLCAMQMEGIVSKSVEVLYRSGQNEAWLKIKRVRRAKFPIVSFVEDLDGVAAMHLAKRQGKDFVFVGKVGTGYNRKSSMEMGS